MQQVVIDKTVQKNAPKIYSYLVTYDKNISSIASSDAAMSLIGGYRHIFNYSDSIAVVALNILSLIARYVVTNWICVGNHEIGRHGASARAFGVKVARYAIGAFTGATYYNAFALPVHEQIAIDTGGIQANYLLSEIIKDRCISSHSMNPTYAMGYLLARLEQAKYSLATKFNDEDLKGNDIRPYVKGINNIYGNDYITKNKIITYAYLDLFDPFLRYSAYSGIMNRHLHKIPMIDFGAISYLPAIRAILAPYGLGFGLVNHFVIDDKYIQLNLNYGNHPQSQFYGVGIKSNNLVKLDGIALALEAAYWHPPKMRTNRPLQEKCKGGLGVVNGKLSLNETFKIVGSGGYKTAGCIEGMPLASALIFRVGLNVEVKI